MKRTYIFAPNKFTKSCISSRRSPKSAFPRVHKTKCKHATSDLPRCMFCVNPPRLVPHKWMRYFLLNSHNKQKGERHVYVTRYPYNGTWRSCGFQLSMCVRTVWAVLYLFDLDKSPKVNEKLDVTASCQKLIKFVHVWEADSIKELQ